MASSPSSYATLGGGSGGYGYHEPTRPLTRFGLFGFHVVALVGGAIANIVVVIVLVILLEILSGAPGVSNLAATLTYERMFGVLLFISWVIACGIMAVVGQVFFTRNGDDFFDFAAGGLAAGLIALVVLGLLGWADGWGAVLPATGMTIGYIWGTLRDLRAGRMPS